MAYNRDERTRVSEVCPCPSPCPRFADMPVSEVVSVSVHLLFGSIRYQNPECRLSYFGEFRPAEISWNSFLGTENTPAEYICFQKYKNVRHLGNSPLKPQCFSPCIPIWNPPKHREFDRSKGVKFIWRSGYW